MYEDDKWNPVNPGPELEGFINQVGIVDERFRANISTTQVAWRALPFYERVALVRMRDRNWKPDNLTIYYLADQGELHRLDSKDETIYKINAKYPVAINEDNIFVYIRFYFFFLRSTHGLFLLLEDLSDPYIPSDLDEASRRALEGTFRPPIYEGRHENGAHLCEAVMYYANYIFMTQISVSPSGKVDIIGEEPLSGKLNAAVDEPISVS